MQTFIQKISSRKLWAAVVGVATGLAMVFGLDQDIITSVAGAVVSLVSLITYIVTEGKIDAEMAKATVIAFEKAREETTNGK